MSAPRHLFVLFGPVAPLAIAGIALTLLASSRPMSSPSSRTTAGVLPPPLPQRPPARRVSRAYERRSDLRSGSRARRSTGRTRKPVARAPSTDGRYGP
jgi:hypothetical protein